jgi:HEAT repeat protein
VFRTCLVISALLFVALGSGVFFAYVVDPAELDWVWHAGKSRSAWVKQLESPDPELRDEAATALAELGERAIPALVDRLQGNSSYVRDAASAGLANMGDTAFEAMRSAHHLPRNQGIRDRFRAVIVRMGPTAVPRLAALLASPDLSDVDLALATLPEMAPAAEQVLPPLAQLIDRRERTPDVIRLLGRLGRPGVELLIGFLRSPAADERIAALTALRDMATEAEQAAGTVEKLADSDNDAQVVAVAKEALRAIRPPAIPD